MEIPVESKSDKSLVLAIDIGIHYTGLGFSTKREWKKVKTCQWPQSENFSSRFKVSTCLLLKKDTLQSCFGYDAEEKYEEIKLDGLHHDYHFFKEFPSILHEDLVCI